MPKAFAWLRYDATLILSGGVLMLCGQLLRLDGQPRSVVSMLLLSSGLLAFALGMATVQGSAFTKRLAAALARRSTRLRIMPDQMILLLLSVGLGVTASAAAGDGPKMFQPLLGYLAWGGSILTAVLGCWMPSRGARRDSAPLLLAAGIFLIALPLRAALVNSIPTSLTGDEASAGLFAASYLNGETNNPFTSGWYAFPSFYFLIQAIPIGLLGQTTAALRLPSALAGAATVGAVYLLGLYLFNRRTGLLAALLLGVLHLHIHFSRIGLNNIWDGLVVVIAMTGFWQGWKIGRRGPFVLAGLALGFGQYFYTSSRIFLPMLAGFSLLYWLIDRKHVRERLPDLALMFLVALVVSLPLNVYYIRNPDIFMAPLRRVSILGPWLQAEVERTQTSVAQILWNQLVAGWKGYADTPLRSWYEPGAPMLRTLPGLFFYLGLALLLLRLIEARSIVLLLWVAMFIAVGGLSESTPAAQRYVAAAPAAVLVAAHGLERLADQLESFWPRRALLVNVLLVTVMVYVGLDEVNFYFRTYNSKANLGGANTLVAQRLAETLNRLPEEREVYFYGSPRMGYHSISSIKYLAPQVEGFDCNQPWGSPENPLPKNGGAIFVFLPDHEVDLQAAQSAYPGGELLTEYDPEGRVLYWLYNLN